MQPPRVLILTALESETCALAAALHLHRHPEHPQLWKNDRIIALGIGLRAAHLQRAFDLLSAHRPQVIVLAGLAGALDPTLKVGDVLIDSPLPPLNIPPGTRAGRIHTASELLCTPEAKQQLFRSSACAAVDMEAAAVAPIATAAGIPFLHVRAISDAATDHVDADCLSLIDSDGHPILRRVVRLLVRRPTVIAQLLRLRRDTSLALSRLSQTMRHLAASGWLPV
ncbi:MAG TPA: hypothetical protein VH253_09490 [Phycisphaerae bacterium]|nr:hypothetical protein [Phycisphaerae bacterium]